MSQIPIGPALDALGIEWTYDDGDVITDAIVIAKVSGADGATRLLSVLSDGMDFITRMGLLEGARRVDGADTLIDRDDED